MLCPSTANGRVRARERQASATTSAIAWAVGSCSCVLRF